MTIKDFRGQVKVADVQNAFDEIVGRINTQVDIYNGFYDFEDYDITKGSPLLGAANYSLSVGGLKSVLNSYDSTVIGCKAFKIDSSHILITDGFYITSDHVYRINQRVIDASSSGTEITSWEGLTEVGDLTDDGGVYSGFSDANYLYGEPDSTVVMQSDFEVKFRFYAYFSSSGSNNQFGVFHLESPNNPYSSAYLNVYDGNRTPSINFAYDNSWGSTSLFFSATKPKSDWHSGWYTLHAKINANSQTCTILDESTGNYLSVSKSVSGTPSYNLNFNKIYIGGGGGHVYFWGKIDLNNSYIKVDGTNFCSTTYTRGDKYLYYNYITDNFLVSDTRNLTDPNNVFVTYLNWASNDILLSGIEDLQLEGVNSRIYTQNRYVPHEGHVWESLDTFSNGKFVAYVLRNVTNAARDSGYCNFMGVDVLNSYRSESGLYRKHWGTHPISLLYIPKGFVPSISHSGAAGQYVYDYTIKNE